MSSFRRIQLLARPLPRLGMQHLLNFAGFLGLMLGLQTTATAAPQRAVFEMGDDTLIAANRSATRTLLEFYVPSNPDNRTHKYIKDWTAKDLRQVGPKDLSLIRDVLEGENYNMVDAIVPKIMSREDFYRAILRESAHRGIIQDYYVEALLKNPQQRQQKISLQRVAFGVPGAIPENVRELAGVIGIRDMAINLISDASNRPYVRVEQDWAKQLGLSVNGAMPMKTDVHAYDFGYTVGSMPQYRNNDALHIVVSSPLPPAELQEKYCPVVRAIFTEGTAYINSDNFRTGFLQARIDARTNFEPVTEHVGLFAECR